MRFLGVINVFQGDGSEEIEGEDFLVGCKVKCL